MSFHLSQVTQSLKRIVLSALVFTSLIGQVGAQSESAALQQLLDSKELKSAHVGVFVYDDSSKRVIADYQGDKYFIPASNTKLFSLYAGMKYLGDSILGANIIQNDTAVYIWATGDPTFLHPDFLSQPVFDFLKKSGKKIYLSLGYNQWQETPWGLGWAWDDYNDDYAIERSPFPIYGNFIRWNQQNSTVRSNPAFGATATVSSSPEIPWRVRFSSDSPSKTFEVKRLMDSNVFVARTGVEPNATQDVPFITHVMNAATELLVDTLGHPVGIIQQDKPSGWTTNPDKIEVPVAYSRYIQIYSRPVDSVFIPMMYRSDNFFAEQTLLMVSQKELNFMKDDSVIGFVLNHSLSDLPQKPSWVDGSGLSRFNLFSPLDFVTLLIKFKNEFGMDRMKKILPTGGSGTLKNYYHSDSGSVYAKTGSLTGVICISGYIYTVRKRLLEFSILVNNNEGGGSAIRRSVENYVESLRKNY